MPSPSLDLLLDAVGFLAPDGAISPENKAMQVLLRRLQFLQLPPNLRQLPMAEEDMGELRVYLQSGEGVFEQMIVLQAVGERLYLRIRLQPSADPSGHWLVLREETVERQAQARAGRLDRLHQLGKLGEGVVHDLNNLMGAVMGLADHMAEETSDAELRGFLQEMVRGTQQRAQILQSLHRAMSQGRRGPERVSLAAVLGDALEVVTKTAIHEGRSVESQIDAETPEVRAVAEDVMHLGLFFLNRSLRSSQGSIRVQVGAARWPGETPRACGRMSIEDEGDAEAARELHGFLTQRRPGSGVAGRYQLDDEMVGVFATLLRLRIQGAEFTLDLQEAGRCRWVLYLPAAGQRA